ncbi:MAG: sulfite exporter TauE/SafE family protein [Actinomycetota bacterium]|nr:sulfite exporter TauE/SafE family protein [Actinomycetota bacterium]
MRRLLLVVAFAGALAAPAVADAHPLGNFTVNRFAAIELSGDRVYVRYALDLAEIPTFQEGDRVRGPNFAARIARGLVLRIDGKRARLSLRERRLVARPGAGGLETLRFDAVYEADRSGSTLTFRDTNFASRVGWKEVVVTAARGAVIRRSTVPARSVSNALRSYPDDLLEAPLDVTSAHVRFQAGTESGLPPSLAPTRAEEREGGGFEALISQGELGLGVVLASLAIAMFWGAAHALTPGHGKAIVAAYLVGSRGKPRHAFLLGVVVTVTHTIGVFALGLVTLLLSRFIVPERLYPWLTLVSGLLVVAVGATVLRKRLKHRRAGEHDHEHTGAGGHSHHHHHGGHHHHDHAVAARHAHDGHGHHDHRAGDRGARGLLGVGVAAGLLPCPSALVVLLSAIALHRVGFGLVLILAFSVGLAATISAIGLVAVFARRAFARLRLDGPLVRALPAASALLILAVGLGITVNAVPEVL